MIVIELKRNLEDYGNDAFGHPEIDRPKWIKFMNALDEKQHYEVELIDNAKCIVFNANGEIIPLHKYIESPHQNYFLPSENIKKT